MKLDMLTHTYNPSTGVAKSGVLSSRLTFAMYVVIPPYPKATPPQKKTAERLTERQKMRRKDVWASTRKLGLKLLYVYKTKQIEKVLELELYLV